MNGVFSTESNNPKLRETTVSHSMASGVNLKFVIRDKSPISWNIFHNHTLRVCPSDDQIKCTIPSVGWGCHIYLRPIETCISVRDGSFLVTVRWVTDIQRNFTWILSMKTNSTITPIRLLQAPLPCELIQVWSCITALQGYGGCNMSLCRNAVYNINLWGATIFLLELKNKTEKLR